MTVPPFTPELAGRAIPLLRSVAADLRAATLELASLRHVPASAERDARRADLNRTMLECSRELDLIGCLFRGFHQGHALFAFPATVAGLPVFLCWRADEDKVGHFHGMDQGFAQRRPLGLAAAAPA